MGDAVKLYDTSIPPSNSTPWITKKKEKNKEREREGRTKKRRPAPPKKTKEKNRMATSVDDGTHVQHANAKLRKTTSDRCSSTTLSIHIDVVFLLACNWSKWVSLWSLTTFFFSFTLIYSTGLGRTVSFCFFLPSFTGFSWFSSGLLRVLLGFIGFYWAIALFCRVLLGCARFYWNLLGFTGFNWFLLDLSSFIGLY